MVSKYLPMLSSVEMLEAAHKFDLSAVVARYIKEFGETEVRSLEIAEELKRFLVLCALDKTKGYAVRDPVDQMWHTFIIFTKNYFDFCRALGRPYLHHDPTPELEKKRDPKAMLESYERLLIDYRVIFKCDPPTSVWPSPGLLPMKGPDCGPKCSYYPPCCNKP